MWQGRTDAEMVSITFGGDSVTVAMRASADSGAVTVFGYVAARPAGSSRTGRQLTTVNSQPVTCPQVRQGSLPYIALYVMA